MSTAGNPPGPLGDLDRMRISARALAALTGLALLTTTALTGCGTAKDATGAPAPNESVQQATVTVTDPWAKAAGSGMSAVFGTLVNHSTKELTVVSATTPVSTVELHEVVSRDGEMVMQPKQGGFAVPAGGTHALAPGGDHLMLMELKAPLKPGDRVEMTLALSDGSTVVFAAIAKDFTGGGESYDPGMGH